MQKPQPQKENKIYMTQIGKYNEVKGYFKQWMQRISWVINSLYYVTEGLQLKTNKKKSLFGDLSSPVGIENLSNDSQISLVFDEILIDLITNFPSFRRLGISQCWQFLMKTWKAFKMKLWLIMTELIVTHRTTYCHD